MNFYTPNKRGRIKQLLLVMKLTTLLIILTCFKVSATVAQTITLNAKNAPLSQILKQIEKQSGYSVFYENELLKTTNKVSINLNKSPLKDALDKCLNNQPLTYEIVDNTVVIKKKDKTVVQKIKELLAPPVDIHGKVTDEKGQPLPGVVIRIKKSRETTLSNNNGDFSFSNIPDSATLVFSFIGYLPKEILVISNTANLNISLEPDIKVLKEVTVSTGYQDIPKERATGSFLVLDSTLLNRRVSTNVLDRLNGMVTGVYFNNGTYADGINTTGINIRGISTFYSSSDPLIVVDNFPYNGNLANLNPNDIDNITVLKDAAAASIWGAQSGNGVIVITTKKGKLNQRMKVEFNANTTISNKPNLFYDKTFMSAKDYIGVEQVLFDNGFLDSYINDTYTYSAVTPAVELMVKYKAASTDAARAQIQSQLDALKNNDVRYDYDKYVYQKSVNQQYSLGIRGGSNNLAYTLSVGHDRNSYSLRRNGYERTTINSTNTYRPVKNLELMAGINFSQNTTTSDNSYGFGRYYGVGGPYYNLYPYARLADDNGNPLAISAGIRESYLVSAEAKGFLDWHLRPLDEINNADNTNKISDYLLKAGAKYQIIPQLSVQLNYQNEKQVIRGRNLQSQQTYAARNMINTFAVYNASTNSFNYRFPLGGILTLQNYDYTANNLRGQLNYDQQIGNHRVTAIAGSELREVTSEGFDRTSYGYDDAYGTSSMTLDYLNYVTVNPGGSSIIPAPGGNISGTLNRYISYYANGAYSYKDKYTINLSGRKDGTNLFGAKTNQKVTPLWSAGLGWTANKESFYHIDWLPYLRLRTTYGYNGNIYSNGVAYLKGYYSTGNNGQITIATPTPPNPELRWEKVRNINWGLDFELKNQRLKGTVEYYFKDGKDLIQPTNLAPQTGWTTYMANTASTHTYGWDITLNSRNTTGKFQWNSTLLLSTVKDKVVRFDGVLNAYSIQTHFNAVGKPLYGIYSYKWAGLNPQNGNPRGYLNGKVSEDYTAIMNNYSPDSLVYNGSTRPTVFGAVRNDFSYKGFKLSVNITYQFGFVFRRPSVGLNYTDIIQFSQHSDYALRWQKPGDELITNVPSIVYPSNANRANFYKYSEVLVEKGDHIRLQDIRLGYEFSKLKILSAYLKNMQVYAYASNLGIIWRNNKLGLDPNNFEMGSIPAPFTMAFGISGNF